MTLVVACRYDGNGILGKILRQMRQEEFLSAGLAKQLSALWSSPVDEERATILCSTRKAAAAAAKGALSLLTGTEHVYHAIDFRGCVSNNAYTVCQDEGNRPVKRGDWDAYVNEDNQCASLFNTLAADARLGLKMGSQVVFTQNCKPLLVTNGTKGKVVSFQSVAWQELDQQIKEMDLPYGVTKPMIQQFWSRINAGHQWPSVMFTNTEGMLSIKPVIPALFSREDQFDRVICCRMQLPLLSAHGLTIHRAQGMSLASVVINCARIFAKGQLYSACSRGPDDAKTKLVGPMQEGMLLAAREVIEWERDRVVWHDIDNSPSAVGGSLHAQSSSARERQWDIIEID